MKKILDGYISLVQEMLGLRNDASFLSVPADLTVLILVCGMIGLLRNTMSTAWNVLPGYYSFLPDILWTMFNFPIYLFLFPGALLHWLLYRLGYRDVRLETVFALSFYLQLIHLIVPFIDWLGYRLGMPWAYTLGTDIVRTSWYTNRIYMTPGIIVGWWITAYVVVKVFHQRLEVHWYAAILASLITFLTIFFPTYIFFTGLNTIFNRTFGLWYWDPQNYMFDSPSWFLQWGSGTYFALAALFGLIYYLKHRSKDNA